MLPVLSEFVMSVVQFGRWALGVGRWALGAGSGEWGANAPLGLGVLFAEGGKIEQRNNNQRQQGGNQNPKN